MSLVEVLWSWPLLSRWTQRLVVCMNATIYQVKFLYLPQVPSWSSSSVSPSYLCPPFFVSFLILSQENGKEIHLQVGKRHMIFLALLFRHDHFQVVSFLVLLSCCFFFLLSSSRCAQTKQCLWVNRMNRSVHYIWPITTFCNQIRKSTFVKDAVKLAWQRPAFSRLYYSDQSQHFVTK